MLEEDKAKSSGRLVATAARVGGFLLRLLVGLALMLVVPQIIMENASPSMGRLSAALISVAVAIAVFFIFVRTTEGRWPGVFRLNRAHELAACVVLGIFLSAASVTLLWMLGAYQVDSVLPVGGWGRVLIGALPVAILSGFSEELAIRGVITRQIARTFNPLAALIVSAVLFGTIHLLNDNSSLAVGLGLIVQAGLLLGAAYLWTQRLWLPIGLHIAWNFMQAGIVGGALSGNKVTAILTARPHGPDWLSGGAFGIEGSVVTTAVCFLAAAAIIYRTARTGLSWTSPLPSDG